MALPPLENFRKLRSANLDVQVDFEAVTHVFEFRLGPLLHRVILRIGFYNESSICSRSALDLLTTIVPFASGT